MMETVREAGAAPAIVLRGLRKLYGAFAAVDGVDLEVRHGEIFGFLGPNGAGKTTTMNVIAGIIRPSAGTILVDGIDVVADPLAAKQRLGYVPDRPFVYEKLTGLEFLEFLGGLYRVPTARARGRAEELLARFDLAPWGGEFIENYSHGMKQRLVMAGAFLHDPSVLIVDEPMVGLDPRGARLVKDTFRALTRQEGRTVFMSTHSLSVAEEVCDRVAILLAGKVIALGTVEELRARSGGEGHLEQVFLTLTGEAGGVRHRNEVET